MRITESLNRDWKFIFTKMPDDKVYRREYDDSWWQTVNLPHTPHIEAHDVVLPLQGQAWYRKTFFLPESYRGKKIFIEFEGAMQNAILCVNGWEILRHHGGYLPFVADLTNVVECGRNNTIALFLENIDDPDTPPGKSSYKLDFQYFGGIYRNVKLHVTDRLHITDAIYKNLCADGGVFVRYENVSERCADLLTSVNLDNEYGEEKRASVRLSLLDASGACVLEDEKAVALGAGENLTVRFTDTLKTPHLWSTDDPYLYTLRAEIVADGETVDRLDTVIGIRTVRVTREGMFLNGKKLSLEGANRHQQYPHLGIAVSDAAHAREMRLLKESGFSLLRLCHYPQSPAVYDACDRLGIVVIECTPGWQWCLESGPFRTRAYRNIREMIRRDRNHPSVILWEVSLNETGATEKFMWNDKWSGADDDFMHTCHLIAHEEYPGDQMITAGDTVGRVDPDFVGFDVRYPAADNDPNAGRTKKPVFRREYGDFEFGFHFSTSRQERRFGEHAMLNAAWNFVFADNRDRSTEGIVGNAIWVGIDYTRPYFIPEPICTCGAFDLFRIPRFTAEYFRSYREDTPHVFLADYWSETEPVRKVVVFSNCEEVELFVNGHSVGRHRAARGAQAPYALPDKYREAGYWRGNKMNMRDDTLDITKEYNRAVDTYCFDGSSCDRLKYPPFLFFDVPFEKGELLAVGYRDGKEVARDARRSNPTPAALRLRIAEEGIPLAADGVDFAFAYASVVDRDGYPCPLAEPLVTFSAEGGNLVGRTTLPADGGVAPVMVRRTENRLTLTASAEGLAPATLVLGD